MACAASCCPSCCVSGSSARRLSRLDSSSRSARRRSSSPVPPPSAVIATSSRKLSITCWRSNSKSACGCSSAVSRMGGNSARSAMVGPISTPPEPQALRIIAASRIFNLHFSPAFVARRRKAVPCMTFATTPTNDCLQRQSLVGGCAGIVLTMLSALTELKSCRVRHSAVAVIIAGPTICRICAPVQNVHSGVTEGRAVVGCGWLRWPIG